MIKTQPEQTNNQEDYFSDVFCRDIRPFGSKSTYGESTGKVIR